MPNFLILMIGLAIASFVYLFIRIITIKKGDYQNALGLSGIPRIEELRVKDGWSMGAKVDEFVHIANTIEGWKLQTKSIVGFVQNEAHREALLRDFDSLKKQAELDLIIGKNQAGDEGMAEFIRRRETFIKNADIEITRLQSWKPTPKEEREINFREFNAKAICTVSNDSARKLLIGGTIYIFEEGDFVILQELVDIKQKRQLARTVITKANVGQPIKVSFDAVSISRLVLSEQKTGREESRVL